MISGPTSDSPSGEGSDAALQSRPLPAFGFAKFHASVIERLKTEIAGAKFVEKLGSKKRAAAQVSSAASGPGRADTEDKFDVTDILQPKKKARKASTKAKAKAKPRGAGDAPEGDVEMAVAQEFGERPRWWIDDVLCCMIHAAGGALPRQR